MNNLETYNTIEDYYCKNYKIYEGIVSFEEFKEINKFFNSMEPEDEYIGNKSLGKQLHEPVIPYTKHNHHIEPKSGPIYYIPATCLRERWGPELSTLREATYQILEAIYRLDSVSRVTVKSRWALISSMELIFIQNKLTSVWLGSHRMYEHDI